jgi:hypothetical protein
MFFLHNALVPHVEFTYTYIMRNSIEVFVVLGSLLFGMALINWVHNFTPSFIYRDETEIVIEDDIA